MTRSLGSSRVRLLARVERPNPPVDADARGHAVICIGWRARAGYRERYVQRMP